MKSNVPSTQRLNTTNKLPADAFHQCPACKSNELIQFEGAVLCSQCAWDSCQASVDSGLMDKYFARPDVVRDQVTTKRQMPTAALKKRIA